MSAPDLAALAERVLHKHLAKDGFGGSNVKKDTSNSSRANQLWDRGGRDRSIQIVRKLGATVHVEKFEPRVVAVQGCANGAAAFRHTIVFHTQLHYTLRTPP